MAFSFCRLFFWAFMPHLSLWAFFLRHTTIRKEGLRKVLDDKKCWGQRSRPALFFSGQRGEDRNSFVSIHRNKFAVQKQRLSDGAMKKRTLGEAENKEKGSTESKTSHTVLQAKPYSYLPATSGRKRIQLCLQSRMACFTFRSSLFLVFYLPLAAFS